MSSLTLESSCITSQKATSNGFCWLDKEPSDSSYSKGRTERKRIFLDDSANSLLTYVQTLMQAGCSVKDAQYGEDGR